jgi:hypothetical protein
MRQLDFGCKINRQNIADNFNIPLSNVTQVDSMQLFLVTLSNDKIALVSYYTIIGYNVFGQWYITNEKFSATTNRQVSKFNSKQDYTVKFVSDINNINFEA